MISSKYKHSQTTKFPLVKPRLNEKEKIEWLVAELAKERESLVYRERGLQAEHPVLEIDNLSSKAEDSSEVNPYRPHPLHHLLEETYGTLADSLDFDHYPNWYRPNVHKAIKAAYEDIEQEFPPRSFVWALVILCSTFLLGWYIGYDQSSQETSHLGSLKNIPHLVYSFQEKS